MSTHSLTLGTSNDSGRWPTKAVKVQPSDVTITVATCYQGVGLDKKHNEGDNGRRCFGHNHTACSGFCWLLSENIDSQMEW